MSFDLIFLYLSFLSPILAGFLISLVGNKLNIYRTLPFISLFISVFSTAALWKKIYHNSLSIVNNTFYVDGFSILMQFMVEFVAFFVILFSLKYLNRGFYDSLRKKFSFYYGIILLSTGFMNLSFILNNLFFVYIAIEVSSIIAVYLIAFSFKKEALKSSFKYLLIVNVGILFSLLGITLLVYNAESMVYVSNISETVLSIPKETSLLCALFLIIGFFTKAGLFPFHLWLPDAYAEAPTPVTVFLAGAVTKIGFYGLVRTTTVFSFNFEDIKFLIIIISSLSMLFGAILAFNQKDIKKLIAYCSISEMGFISSAIALDNYLGIFGGIFHMINHTLMKGILFFSAGILIFLTENREIDKIKTSLGKLPVVSSVFFTGALAVGGMPLFGSFLSSLSIFLALSDEGFLWCSFILIFSGFISMIALLKTATYIFWEKSENKSLQINAPKSMVLCLFVFVLLILLFGIYPEIIHPLIDNASYGILKMVK